MKDPLAVAELNFNIRGLVVPEPGRYFVEFWCDDEILVDRHFDATQWKGGPSSGGPSSGEPSQGGPGPGGNRR